MDFLGRLMLDWFSFYRGFTIASACQLSVYIWALNQQADNHFLKTVSNP